MKNKHIKFIAVIYLVILSVGTIFYYFIPKEKFIHLKSQKEITESQKKYAVFEEKVYSAENLNLAGWEKVKDYVLDYEGKELNIDTIHSTGQRLVGRKNVNDNKIEVYIYRFPVNFQGIDITDKIKPEKIELVDNKLNFVYEKQEFKYVEFPKDFTITQFCEEKTDMSQKGFSGMGLSIIYIKIPKDLIILNDKQVNFVK